MYVFTLVLNSELLCFLLWFSCAPLSPAEPQTFSFLLFRSLYFTLFSPSTGDEELYIQQAVVFIEDAIKVREQNFVKSSTLILLHDSCTVGASGKQACRKALSPHL